MSSKKHTLPRIFISIIVCFISIQKSRCQITQAATNPPGIGCIGDPTYCKNGGECIDTVCQCQIGFTGNMCEIIECSSGTCQNGGDCLTEATSDTSNVCICAPGFQGTFCEEVNPEETCTINCASGTCSSNHTCVCNPGFKGIYCQEQITCFDEPCQNGGECVLLARRKRQVLLPPSPAGCSCREPYAGSFCEIKLPPCDIDCKNNGECLLHPESLNYYCACAFNYYGDFCENAELCDEIGCNFMGTCVEGSCVCFEGRYGAFCELDICSTRPCENGGLCILPINEFFSEVIIPTTEFLCACSPGFRGPTCVGVIVECGRNEFLCASGECIPLSKKCDSVAYDCADNSDELDGECKNNNECGDLLADLDLLTRECGDLSTPFQTFIESESESLINVWKFNSPPSDFPDASNIISQITINIESYMGTDILSDGTLFVSLTSSTSVIQTQVYYFKVLYQNGDGQTNFIKYLTDIYNMDLNGQYVSLSFLPDGSTDHKLLPFFRCEIISEEQTSSCITLLTRMFIPECNINKCIERYGDWKQASYQKRDLNCGVTSIDSVVDSIYQQCLVPPFITSVSGNMNVGIEEVVTLYCVASGEPTPAVQWLEVSDSGEAIFTSEPADGQIVLELPDVNSATRFVCLASNVANEVVSDDVVISLEDPVCTSLQNLSREFSVSNSACFNETVKNILSNEGQFGGFTYIDEFNEGTVLYAVSFPSTNVYVGGDGESSFRSSYIEQSGPVVLSIHLEILNVITGVNIYSYLFDGIIIDPNIDGSIPINFSFDTPIKINTTSRYEFRLQLRNTDPSYQLNNQPLDVKYVTCASGTQGCQEFISEWNGLISDQIDAGCDDIDIQYAGAELCFGEFFGDPEVIRHPESQVDAIGMTTTLECNIENVEFYEWYKNGKRITSSGPTYSLQLQEGQDQGDYACLGFRSQDDKDASSDTATVLITGVSTFRVLARFQIAFETGYTDRESEEFKNFTRDLQTSLQSELSIPFELYITSIKSGSVITEMEMYFSDQAQNASAVSLMINDTLVALPQYETDPSSVMVTSISTCVGEDVTQDGILYSFPDTPLDTTAESVQDCPLYSDQGITYPLATRYCGGDFVSGAKWSPVMVLDCDIGTTSEQIQRISEVEVTENNGEDVADALADVTNNTADLDADSIETVSSILEDIVALEMPDESITLDVVEIIDNVIESGVLGTNQLMRETASSFVTSLERQLATAAAAGMNFTSVQPHVGVMTLSVSSDSLENGLVYVAFSDGDSVKENFEPNNVKTFFENIFPIDMVGASIALPPEIISISQAQTGEDEIRVYFTVYQNSSLFISNKLAKESGQDFTRQVGSHVISASVEAVKIDGLVYPVKAAFLPRFESINNTECVFWDFSIDDGVGDWSSDGCTYNTTEDERVICFCDHLTNFAILVDYYEPKEDSTLQDVLTIISLIGCIVSIVCLAITIATYLYFKQFRSKRPQRILINLSLSLLLLYLVFAIGIEKTSSRNGCIAVAALIHYFGLASIFWMSIEAVNMYLMFVKVFYDDIEYFMLKVCTVGYGVPLIIVAICLGIDVDNYANENYCFIPSGNVRNFGFILVIGILILFNSLVFILVMRKLTCGRKIAKTIDQSKREIVIKRLQNAISVSVLLGLTWVFGFLAIDSDSSARDVFQTLFCIFNSLQGLFIFLLFCVRQKDIRDAWKGCCKEGDRASRVKYATDTSNKGKIKDQSIPLTHDSTQNSNTQSTNTKSNV